MLWGCAVGFRRSRCAVFSCFYGHHGCAYAGHRQYHLVCVGIVLDVGLYKGSLWIAAASNLPMQSTKLRFSTPDTRNLTMPSNPKDCPLILQKPRTFPPDCFILAYFRLRSVTCCSCWTSLYGTGFRLGCEKVRKDIAFC